MKSHENGHGNGAYGVGVGRGFGNSAEMRLAKLLTEYSTKAQALALALEMLRGQKAEKKAARHETVLDEALALDGQRRQKTQRQSLTRKKKKSAALTQQRTSSTKFQDHSVAGMLARRQHSEKLLAAFDTKIARTPSEAGLNGDEAKQLGSLFRHGYLKHKGDGWVRTKRVFTVKPAWRAGFGEKVGVVAADA